VPLSLWLPLLLSVSLSLTAFTLAGQPSLSGLSFNIIYLLAFKIFPPFKLEGPDRQPLILILADDLPVFYYGYKANDIKIVPKVIKIVPK
jgi:hypothetical protein